MASERRTGILIRRLVAEGLVDAVHDVSDGGLLVAVTEMALAGNMGAALCVPGGFSCAELFGEDQGRFVITTLDPVALTARCREAGVAWSELGGTGFNEIWVAEEVPHGERVQAKVPLADLRAANERFFREWMET